MVLITLTNGTDMNPDKSIKINAMAHKALEMLKANEGINQNIFASVAVIDAIRDDYPHVYKALKDWALRNQAVAELEELEGHSLKAS